MLLFNTLKNNYHFYHHSAALWHAFIITLKNNYEYHYSAVLYRNKK